MEPRIALLDANVLVQRHVRDLLLHAVSSGAMYEVRWSDAILEEARRTLVRLGRVPEPRASDFVKALTRTFTQAAVTMYEPLIAQMKNDAKDRHVAAAAVHAGAEIVTFNLRDFPVASLAPFGIRAIHPDQFLLELFDTSAETMPAVLRDLLTERQYASTTPEAFLHRLASTTPLFAAAMRARLAP